MDLNNSDILTAACVDQTVVIRVGGRGSFKISPPLKQFIHRIIVTRSANDILLEMSHCSGMDSTFMGVIAGIACFVKSQPATHFQLINLSEKNMKLMVTLGVDRVVDYSMSVTDEQQVLLDRLEGDEKTIKAGAADKLEAAKTTLEAHETLVDIHPGNLIKFKSVIEYLQDDVRNLTND